MNQTTHVDRQTWDKKPEDAAERDSLSSGSSVCSQAYEDDHAFKVSSAWIDASHDEKTANDGFVEVSMNGIPQDHLPIRMDLTTGNRPTVRGNIESLILVAYRMGHRDGQELTKQKVRDFANWAKS